MCFTCTFIGNFSDQKITGIHSDGAWRDLHAGSGDIGCGEHFQSVKGRLRLYDYLVIAARSLWHEPAFLNQQIFAIGPLAALLMITDTIPFAFPTEKIGRINIGVRDGPAEFEDNLL